MSGCRSGQVSFADVVVYGCTLAAGHEGPHMDDRAPGKPDATWSTGRPPAHECEHDRVRPDVWDHALVVVCDDCNALIGHCWRDSHVSEQEWTVPIVRGDTAEVVVRMLASAMNERGAEERERTLAGVLTVDVEARWPSETT